MHGCPQLGLEVDEGDVEAPNPCTVEATRRTKWPPRGQATENGRGPAQPPRMTSRECDPNALKGTGTCKPKDEPAILKSAAPGHLEGKSWHREGEPPRKGLVYPKGYHFEAAEPRSRTSSSAKKEPYKIQISNVNTRDTTLKSVTVKHSVEQLKRTRVSSTDLTPQSSLPGLGSVPLQRLCQRCLVHLDESATQLSGLQ